MKHFLRGVAALTLSNVIAAVVVHILIKETKATATE